MFQDVLLFELFQRTLPNPFLCPFKSIEKRKSRKIPKKSRKNPEKIPKNAYCALTAPGGQYAFLRTSQQPISVLHDLKTSLDVYNNSSFLHIVAIDILMGKPIIPRETNETYNHTRINQNFKFWALKFILKYITILPDHSRNLISYMSLSMFLFLTCE